MYGNTHSPLSLSHTHTEHEADDLGISLHTTQQSLVYIGTCEKCITDECKVSSSFRAYAVH